MFCVGTDILAHFSGSGGSPIILSAPFYGIKKKAKLIQGNEKLMSMKSGNSELKI